MSTVLVVAAHPDDEILGAGGALAKHVDLGDEVHAVIVSEGATSRYTEGEASVLRVASEQSAAVIGFASLDHLELPDQRLDGSPLIDLTQAIEPILQRLRPSHVYTHSHVDVNTDHGQVARAVWTSCRPYAAPFVERLLAFETPSSTEWAWPTSDNAFLATWFVDIEFTLARKLEAMACYDTELRPYPHPRSIRALTERAAYWGSVAGLVSAEPLTLVRGRS